MTIDLVARPQVISGGAIFGFVNGISTTTVYLVSGICYLVLQLVEYKSLKMTVKKI